MTRWTELDPRSLALFRITLGFFVLLDTLMRLPYLGDFTTDDGVLPRLALVNSPYADYWLSFHLGSGNLTGQVVLSLLTASLAVAMIAGYQTRLATIGCWLLVNSVQARNPFIGDRGDLQLSLLLLWAIFLPTDQVWCFKKSARPRSAPRLAVAGLVTQFASIYLFTAMLKTGDFWLARGDGLKFSLLSPMFAAPLASKLAALSDPTLRLLNYSVIAGELFVGFLLLSPFMVSLCRQLAVGLLLIFHLTVLATFNLGLFPLIGAMTPWALLPREFWDRFQPPLENPQRVADSHWRLQARRAFLLALLVLSLLSNLSTLGLERPNWISKLSAIVRVEQHWELFSPLPPINGYFRVVRLSPDGEEKVLFQGPPTTAHPQAQAFPGHRWKMLMLATIYPEFSFLREPVARVLARKFGNDSSGKIRYTFTLNPISEKGTFKPPVIQSLWREP